MKKFALLGLIMTLGFGGVQGDIVRPAEERLTGFADDDRYDGSREERITHIPFTLRFVPPSSSEHDELAKMYADLEWDNEVYNLEDPYFLACDFPKREGEHWPATFYFAHRAEESWDNARLLTLHNEAAAEVRGDAANDQEDRKRYITLAAIRAALPTLAPQVRERGAGKYDLDLLSYAIQGIESREVLDYDFKLARWDGKYAPIFGEVLIRKEGAQRKIESHLVRTKAEKQVKAKFELFRVKDQMLKRLDPHQISDLIK